MFMIYTLNLQRDLFVGGNIDASSKTLIGIASNVHFNKSFVLIAVSSPHIVYVLDMLCT